jgi:hypothetical protein
MTRRLQNFLYTALALLLAILIILQYDTSQPSVVRGNTADKLFPSDSGIINVKNYGAKGDGVTNDTQAIQSAIKSGSRGYGQQNTIYFPKGTYLVSKRLEWRDSQGNWLPYLIFQGQSRTNTIIKLKNNALGYSDLNVPKAVIVTASQNATPDGGGNQAFFNSIYDLTVDTGSGNPGAIGIDYMANNEGTIRDVTIRGQGRVGLSLSRAWPGPCLIKNVRIEGFDVGIASHYHYQFGVTFEHITLANQKRLGIVNENNVLSINGLTSTNSVPVIRSKGNESLITLLNGNFSGGSSSVSAIENKGTLYARNIKTTGYRSAIQNKDTVVPGKTVSEFVSNSVLHLFPSQRKALNLPILDSPEFNEDVSKWVSVTTFGAKPNDNIDDAAAIQAAIDSGKSTVYFPTGAYKISSTIRVRGNLRKIAGMNSFIEPMPSKQLPNPSLRYELGTSGPLIVERFNVNGWSEHASAQTLVLRDCGHGNYRGTKGAGLLFGENVMIGQWRFEPGQNVWLRQLNTEFTGVTRLVNNGAKLWILGLKTEDPYTVVETKGGGKTEILGGLLYPGQGAKAVPTTDVAFINNKSQVSLVYVTGVDGGGQDYTVHVQETRGGETKKLIKSAIPNRGPGSFVIFSD